METSVEFVQLVVKVTPEMKKRITTIASLTGRTQQDTAVAILDRGMGPAKPTDTPMTFDQALALVSA